MSRSDLMAAFWRPLKRMVEDHDVNRKLLARRLGIGASGLSELLNGKRANAPDWVTIRTIVTECGEGTQLDYWRRRLTDLQAELDFVAAQVNRAPRTDPTPPSGDPDRSSICSVCADEYEDNRFRAHIRELSGDGWPSGSYRAAARVLTGRHPVLRRDADILFDHELDSAAGRDAFRAWLEDLARRLLAGLGARVRCACHLHRVVLLSAAHTVVLLEGVVHGLAFDLGQGDEQYSDTTALSELFDAIFGDGAIAGPLPVASVLYSDHHGQVLDGYTEFASQWAPEATPEQVRQAAARATALYEGRLAELAAECPELFVWAGMQDGPAAAAALNACPTGETRERLESLYRDLHTQHDGLDGLETLLRALSRDMVPGDWPARLSAIYRHDLRRPISPIEGMGDDAPRPRIPMLGKGYVNPAFRTTVQAPGAMPHVNAWWSTRPLREEIQGFLAGHLTAFPTVNRPLIVLGDPGAGKSLLTRLLAARLPPEDYLPLRIELRNVAADAGVLEQIDEALRQATLKDVSWDTVVESSPGVLPVLIFDGFDELLQAGGADHWGYLDAIAEFQQASAENGRPVAAIVTSRTVVADQAHFPDGGVIIRLEPFDSARIARWTDTWNAINSSYFRRHGLTPLGPDIGYSLHPDLATQPLLLLMLALYHSVEHTAGIQPADPTTMSRVDLYERLLRLFVRRQIIKLEPRLRPEALEERIENELDLLSVVAVAMFNRGRQGVSAAEVRYDLEFLRAPDSRAACPEAKLLFGRFFFIHEAKATFEDGTDRRWYEFLHATFGEHMVARKIARTLLRCPDQGPYEGLLFDLLSYAPLTDRAQIIENLRDLLPSWDTVRPLYQFSLDERRPDSRSGYTPKAARVTYRHACYSANLLLLALAPGEIILFSELLAAGTDPATRWNEHALLWKSQLQPEAWDAFARAVGSVPQQAASGTGEEVRDIALCLGRHEMPPTASRAAWVLESSSGPQGRTRLDRDEVLPPQERLDALRRARLLYDRDVETSLEPALAVFEELDDLIGTCVVDSFGRATSSAYALISLLLCPPAPARDLMARYEACLSSLDALSPSTRRRVVTLIAQRLSGESELLPVDFVSDTVWTLVDADVLNRYGDRDDRTRLCLLVVACRVLARVADEQLAVIVVTLLGLTSRHFADDLSIALEGDERVRGVTGMSRVLTLLLRRIETDTELADRESAHLWLLKLAMALDQREWCEKHCAERLEVMDKATPEPAQPIGAHLEPARWRPAPLDV
ncbi:NACHT domain-containing protein [Streptomyces nigra]|uniref:NACHT domain-containing protein n=1 Tax=Streptomyces nigra TaxID=1827580 RepID=UPI000D5272F6|nr:hypothetical protein [Streptomyces nigra]AWE49386.1 hypothetical protein DC008_06450 [Streptomyces nigra]